MSQVVLLRSRTAHPLMIEREMKDGEAIKPGHLLSIDSSDEAIKHATAQARAQRLFADRHYDGQKGIDDAFTDQDTIPIIVANTGDEIYAWARAGEGALAIGDALSAHSDGTLSDTATTLPTAVVGFVIEASATNAAARRIRIRVA